ncbi:MAG: metal ABC transporter substrate-binding protein [Candidatus Nanopelagicales bacterium]
MRHRLLPLAALAATALALTACGSGSGTAAAPGAGSRLPVVAAFYPLQYAVEQVGGDRVSVTSLTAAGAEPHDLELTPQQVAAVSDAGLVVYLKGFQSSVDEAVDQAGGANALDAGAGISTLAPPQGEVDEATAAGEAPPTADPHVWLDPTNMARIVESVAARLSAADPAGAQQYAANAAALTQKLTALDAEWKAGTTTCANRDLVVSHEAFGYLAKRYGLTQVGISGLSPDAEPSPAKVAEVADFVRANKVRTIYYETLVDPKVAQTVASETGAATAVLDPLEGLAEGSTDDYLSVMRANLETVRTSQPCT